MRKKFRLLAISILFISITGNSFATSVGTETVNTGIKDILPFILGGIFIICILFVGYKMDKASENAPTIKKEKNSKIRKQEKALEKQETEAYAEENKSDIPYEEDEDEYYEKDTDFDYDGLNEDTEYEEDDISLFDSNTSQESSFDYIDDEISYDIEDDIDEDITNDITNDIEDNVDEGITNTIEDIASIEELNDESDNLYANEEKDESLSYDLEEKINQLDNIDDIEVPEIIKEEEQDAESFMNEINKYKDEADNSEEFAGFTTKTETKKEDEPNNSETSPKKYTKKKVVEEKLETSIPEEKPEEKEEQSNQMDMDFLNQMEETLKKNQEKRLGKEVVEEDKEEKPKRRGRKPKKQED